MENGNWHKSGTPVHVKQYGDGILRAQMWSVSQVFFPLLCQVVIVDNEEIEIVGELSKSEDLPTQNDHS